MMGRQASGQKQLFYAFDLDTVASDDHLLRGIDASLIKADANRQRVSLVQSRLTDSSFRPLSQYSATEYQMILKQHGILKFINLKTQTKINH